MQPCYPLLQAVRHWAHLGPFPSCSRWGPQKRGSRGLAAPRAQLRRRRAAAPGAAGSSGPRAGRLAWRNRTCTLPSCHPGESLRVPHLESSPLDAGVWAASGDFSTQGCLSGTAGQVGAVLSAPTAEPPPQTLNNPPTSASPCTSGSLDPVTEWWRKAANTVCEHSPPPKPSGSGIRLAQLPPLDRGHQTWALRMPQLAKSLLRHHQPGLLSVA